MRDDARRVHVEKAYGKERAQRLLREFDNFHQSDHIEPNATDSATSKVEAEVDPMQSTFPQDVDMRETEPILQDDEENEFSEN